MKDKKKSFGINVGSSSIMLIFVVLCLVSFSVLAISSAQADRSLSQRLESRTNTYYEAREKIEEDLAAFTDTLPEILHQSGSETEYFSQVGNEKVISYPLSEHQNLEASVTLLYPPRDGAYYRIESFRVTTMEEGIEFDESLDMFMGDFNEDLGGEASFELPF